MGGAAANFDATRVMIYGLSCPTTGKIYYVGASKRPKARYHQHLGSVSLPQGAAISDWLRELLEKGERPVMLFLRQVSSERALEEEQLWITALKLRGEPLLNRYCYYPCRYTGEQRKRCRTANAVRWEPRKRRAKTSPEEVQG